MALGTNAYTHTEYGVGVEILYNHDFLGKSMTLDATSFTSGVCKAGTPIATDGTVFTAATDQVILGLLLHDVESTRPQATVVYAGTIREKAAKTHSGVTYTSTMKAGLPRITWFDIPTA